MSYAVIDGQRVRSGQVILVRSVFDFFDCDSRLRPAKVDFFLNILYRLTSLTILIICLQPLVGQCLIIFDIIIGEPYEIRHLKPVTKTLLSLCATLLRYCYVPKN